LNEKFVWSLRTLLYSEFLSYICLSEEEEEKDFELIDCLLSYQMMVQNEMNASNELPNVC
jgi:hypothetical protein